MARKNVIVAILDEQAESVVPMANRPGFRNPNVARRESASQHTRFADKAIQAKARGAGTRRQLAARFIDFSLIIPEEAS